MRIRYVLPLLLIPVLVLAQQAVNRHLQSKLAADRHLPFSSGVMAGNTLYIAGTIGVEPDAKAALSPEEEARRVMDQVKQVVQQAGMTMDDVVSVQVFCTDLANYDAFNKVYQTYFHGNYPARAFVGIANLLFGARYEVMGVAIRSGK